MCWKELRNPIPCDEKNRICEGCYSIDSMHKREMAIRTKDLRHVNNAMIEKTASLLGGKTVDMAN